MTIHFPTPTMPLDFKAAEARYNSAREAALAAPDDSAAQAAWGRATDAALSAHALSPAEVADKIYLALTEQRTGADVLRLLYRDLLTAPGVDELADVLGEARQALAGVTRAFDGGPRHEARRDQLARIDRALVWQRGGAEPEAGRMERTAA